MLIENSWPWSYDKVGGTDTSQSQREIYIENYLNAHCRSVNVVEVGALLGYDLVYYCQLDFWLPNIYFRRNA